MKKIITLTTAIIVITTLQANGQFTHNTVLKGTAGSGAGSLITIQLNNGYKIKDRVILGAGFGFTIATKNDVILSPLLFHSKLYFNKSDKARGFLNFDIGYAFGKHIKAFVAEPAVGIEFPLDNFGLQLMIGADIFKPYPSSSY